MYMHVNKLYVFLTLNTPNADEFPQSNSFWTLRLNLNKYIYKSPPYVF